MNAIIAPIPEPLPPPAVAEVAPAGTRSMLRPVVALVVVGLLAAATFIAWQRPSAGPSASGSSLAGQLEWMFDAALTYPGSDRSGGVATAPFADVTLESVTVGDPATGPIVAAGTAIRPDGSIDDVTYELEVVRRGEGWTISATRLVPEDARDVNPSGS